MLTGLTLDVTSLVVSLANCTGEVTITRNHDEGHICLGGTGDHILDEIAVTWSINDNEMPFLGVELLCGACNGHISLTLLFLAIHVESKCELRLAQTICLSLQLLQLAFGDATELEDQTTCGGGLAFKTKRSPAQYACGPSRICESLEVLLNKRGSSN